jgi:hypothetical protein
LDSLNAANAWADIKMSWRTLDDDVNSFMNDPDSEFDLGAGGEDSGDEANDSDWGYDHVDTPSGQPVGQKCRAESVAP